MASRFRSRSIICISLFVTIIFVGHSSSQQVYEKSGLSMHNSYRSKHDARPMVLSEELNTKASKCAEDYAVRNAIDHRCRFKSNGEGENLYISYSTGAPPDKTKSVKAAVNMWYGEIKGYNYEHPGQSQGDTGHFTQLVWDGSTQLGCGTGTVRSVTVVCCLYKQHGNIVSQNGDRYRHYRMNVKRRRNRN